MSLSGRIFDGDIADPPEEKVVECAAAVGAQKPGRCAACEPNPLTGTEGFESVARQRGVRPNSARHQDTTVTVPIVKNIGSLALGDFFLATTRVRNEPIAHLDKVTGLQKAFWCRAVVRLWRSRGARCAAANPRKQPSATATTEL